MEDVLTGEDSGRPLAVSVLLDDVAVQEDDLQQNLDDAAEATLRLTRSGAMVGLPKCKFGMTECRHLGDWWTSGSYFCPPEGKLAALVELSEESMASMSCSKLYGMLGYWRQYVQDFSARTACLTRLLRKDAALWGPAHTEEV